MSGVVVAKSIRQYIAGSEILSIPDSTMIGALLNYISSPRKNFQPINANWGILNIDDLKIPRRINKHQKNKILSEYSRTNLTNFLEKFTINQ